MKKISIAWGDAQLGQAYDKIVEAFGKKTGFRLHLEIGVSDAATALLGGTPHDGKQFVYALSKGLVGHYRSPLALRNAHLSEVDAFERLESALKKIGIDVEFRNVGRIMEIARAATLEEAFPTAAAAAPLDSPGGFDALQPAKVVGTPTRKGEGRITSMM